MRAEPGLRPAAPAVAASVPAANYERLAAGPRPARARRDAAGHLGRLIIWVIQHHWWTPHRLRGHARVPLHVLTRLGKQPPLAASGCLLARCGASLFVDTI